MRPSLPARIALQSLLGVLPCFLLGSILSVPRGCAADGVSDRKIEGLIEDLRSDHFEMREAATRALKERLDAIPILRKERWSVDLEVRRRVNDILLTLERKRASRGLAKAKALGKAGRAIEVADRLAVAAKYGVAGDEGWESLTQFTDQLIARTDRYFQPGWKFPRNPEYPIGDFRHFVKLTKPKEIAERRIEIDTGKELDNPKQVRKSFLTTPFSAKSL